MLHTLLLRCMHVGHIVEHLCCMHIGHIVAVLHACRTHCYRVAYMLLLCCIHVGHIVTHVVAVLHTCRTHCCFVALCRIQVLLYCICHHLKQ